MIALVSDRGLVVTDKCSGKYLLIADHNAYHLGQLVYLRRCLGAWKE